MTLASPEFEDPATGVALSRDEIDWLGAYLACKEVPDTAMPLEALDGFFTALVVGPEEVPQAEYLPIVWDTQRRLAAVFSDSAELAECHGLLARHYRAISLRIEAGCGHIPLLADRRPGQDGCAWCYGFMVGIAMRVEAWRPLLASRRLAPVMALIAGLAEADEATGLDAISADERAEITEALSAVPPVIHDYWRDRAAGLDPEAPLRATATGRDEPCPCGSGRQHKRCCGAAV